MPYAIYTLRIRLFEYALLQSSSLATPTISDDLATSGSTRGSLLAGIGPNMSSSSAYTSEIRTDTHLSLCTPSSLLASLCATVSFISPTLWTITVSNDLRACSSALFVMAERTPVVKKYRDALENVMNATMEFLARAPANPNQDQALTSPVLTHGSMARTPQQTHHELSGGARPSHQA